MPDDFSTLAAEDNNLLLKRHARPAFFLDSTFLLLVYPQSTTLPLTVITLLRAQNRPVVEYLVQACRAARQEQSPL